MIENPRTGERIEFDLRTPEKLVMHATWTRPGQRAVEHRHPEMEEHYEVLEGTAAFRIGRVEFRAVAGEHVTVPPGTSHLAWNPTEERVRLRITMRPALRWAEFTERFFTGEPAGALLAEYRREIELVPPAPGGPRP